MQFSLSRLGRDRKWARLAGTTTVIVVVAAVGGAPAVGVVAVPSRFKPAPAGSEITNKPLGLGTALTTVVVEMTGDPVAVRTPMRRAR